MNCFHVLLQAFSQGKLLVTLTAGMGKLLFVYNFNVAPQRRGLIKIPATFLAYDNHSLQVDSFVVFYLKGETGQKKTAYMSATYHVTFLVERFLAFRAQKLL